MKFRNLCLSDLYVKTVGKRITINETFVSEMNDEIRKLVKESKLIIVPEENKVQDKVKDIPTKKKQFTGNKRKMFGIIEEDE